MRPQQQNRRMRGRNNRKGPNPLTRNYESNGPDVKIRGSAQQVADKYTSLARDAQSAGDRVIAENYLQHAEHYNRIIASATAQMQTQMNRDNRDDRDNRDERDDRDDAGGDDFKDEIPSRQDYNARRTPANDGTGPQPVIEGTPAEVVLEEQDRSEKKLGRRPASSDRSFREAAAAGDLSTDSQTMAPMKRSRKPRGGAAPGQKTGAGEDTGDKVANDPALTTAAGE